MLALLLLLAALPGIWADARLEQVLVLIRHGYRTEKRLMLKDLGRCDFQSGPGGVPCYTGHPMELLPTGQQQLFDKGQEYRRKFIVSQPSLLKSTYDSWEAIAICSDYQRTSFSAQSFFAGLYAHAANGPVVSAPFVLISNDPLLRSHARCPLLKELEAEWRASVEYTELASRHSHLVQRLQNITGGFREFVLSPFLDHAPNTADEVEAFRNELGAATIPVTFASIKYVAFFLDLQRRLGVPSLPDLLPLEEEVQRATDIHLQRRFQYPLSLDQPHLAGGVMVDELLTKLDGRVRGELPYRLVLYSGHDITIMTLAVSLGLLDQLGNLPPPLGSDFRFELWSENSSGTSPEFFLEIFLNERQLVVPHCSARCPLETFKALVHRAVDRQRECASASAGFSVVFINALFAALVLLALLVVGLRLRYARIAALLSQAVFFFQPRTPRRVVVD